jgi:hypothetical protein
MQKARSHPPQHPKTLPRLPPLVGTRFQVLFHSPPGVLFTFPSRYSFTIGDGRVFSLGGWSPQIQSGLLGAPNLLRYPCHTCGKASSTGLSPTPADRSRSLRFTPRTSCGTMPHTGPTTPDLRRGLVWALPSSLAATLGISLDFSSCRYLDVSVPRVSSS